jgi:uncharacterized paraquat-inducible protein A
MTNNQGIAHYAPKGAPVCRNEKAHIAVREIGAFRLEPRKCKRCEAYVARIDAMKQRETAVCLRCGSTHRADQSCGCFDNGCQ